MLSNKPTILLYDSKFINDIISAKTYSEMKKIRSHFFNTRKRRNILIEFIKILINGITQLNKKFKKEIFK